MVEALFVVVHGLCHPGPNVADGRLMTAKAECKVTEVQQLLQRTLRSSRGLPQGLSTSDALATAYLRPVDAAMVRAGFHYYRYGDDVRIAVNEYSHAREAVFVLEQELRAVDLIVNAEKSRIMKRAAYQDSLKSVQDAFEATRQWFVDEKAKLLSEDENKLVDAMQDAKLDDEIGNKDQPALRAAIMIEDFLGDVMIIIFALKIKPRFGVAVRTVSFHDPSSLHIFIFRYPAAHAELAKERTTVLRTSGNIINLDVSTGIITRLTNPMAVNIKISRIMFRPSYLPILLLSNLRYIIGISKSNILTTFLQR